ncbi:MAG TPA: rhomboid family intramembrane serine protease [Chthonomonadales bacterium]|nr:rhomboid family intramembrane serine protease [Chthonomonadales bacterium]
MTAPARPTRVDHATRPPILTWVVCLLCVALTAASHLFAARMLPPYEWAGLGRLSLDAIWGGQATGLLISVFFHGSPESVGSSVVHIAFNLLWLFALGRLLEETLHPLAWIAFFVSAAVVSAGTQIAVSQTLSVGASGVVYAMFGLLWAGRARFPDWRIVANRRNLIWLLGWGAFCVVVSWAGLLHVANAAHFSGLLYGLALGWLFLERRRVAASWAILVCLAFLTVCSVRWMPWSPRWVDWKGARSLSRGAIDEAVRWRRHALRLGADPVAVWLDIRAMEAARANRRGVEEAEARLQALLGRTPPRTPPNEPRDDAGIAPSDG